MTVGASTIAGGIVYQPGIHSARPATPLGGALYPCTTHGTIDRYDPSTGWATWATLAGSGLTDPTTTKGDLITRTSSAVTRQAVGSDGQALIADSSQANGMKWAERGLIAYKTYNPGTIATYSTSSTSIGDVDATNLAVTFTVPASGKVLVRLSALAHLGSTAGHFGSWGIRNGSTTVASKFMLVDYAGPRNEDYPGCVAFVVTGLTPGASLTYKWAFFVDNASTTASVYAGGVAGDALMEVEALP